MKIENHHNKTKEVLQISTLTNFQAKQNSTTKMSTKINLLIENRNSSSSPSTTVALPFDQQSHKLSSLHRISGSTSGPILATNISVAALNGATLTKGVNLDNPQDPGKVDYTVNSNGSPTALSSGQAIDISNWSAIAK